PNLFEIVTFDYWHANYGMEADAELIDAYLAEDSGYDHVKSVVEAKLRRQLDGEDLKLAARAFFSGGHDVIVARRHHGGSGSLSKDEHARFIAFTIDAMRDLYEKNPYAKYVAAFQNWLKPAGASFDHLHKQLVAIDEHGPELRSVELEPNVFEERGIELARKHDLIIAENEHAVLFAASGTRIPPWRSTPKHLGAHGNTAQQRCADSAMSSTPRTGRLVLGCRAMKNGTTSPGMCTVRCRGA